MSEWRDAISNPPDIDVPVWIAFVFEDGETGQGYAIYEGKGEWFFDVTEEGDLLSRSKAIKLGMNVAAITHWMCLPCFPDSLRGLKNRTAEVGEFTQ